VRGLNRLVECVPNFSEGRRPEVVEAIVAAVTSVPNIYLLDREMDADHNRAVLTIVGPPESIGPAALRGVEAATKLIDLTKHTGGHPRIGATDVVPFVPIRGVSIDECVQIAREVGRQIAEKFKIPVYLYEAAALRPERTNLENIRKGQFEGLRAEIETNPERKPDFGEPRIHATAGAVVVGARKPLIAYNINLNTPDIAIAKQIAKRIRFSSGGFPCVKAMGVLLQDRNQAQVSMNLTDYETTSVEVVFNAVRREAEAAGVQVVGSEIVGLIPQKALDQVAAAYLQVENYRPSMILENRLAEVMSESMADFIARVASADPVPGGGSVAALAGALGAALGQMAIEITKGKKAFQEHAGRYSTAVEKLGSQRAALLQLVEEDAAAYRKVLQAYKLPKESPTRDDAIQEALIQATEVPSRTAGLAVDALVVLRNLQSNIYPNVASDFEVGVQMLRSAIRGGLANMRINIKEIKDQDIRQRYEGLAANYANYTN
jgi:glutamate formiminotransferase / formiminotetrahydrofolate cyclodeaminase